MSIDIPMSHGQGRWRPRLLQPVMWQTPGFLLKLSITCFLVGLLILIWDSARRSGIGWTSDDMKVAASVQTVETDADYLSDCDTLHCRRGNLPCVICHVRIWIILQNFRISSFI